ncbi:nitroreductase family protein [Methanobrevibacter sp.]|uniref:nitroreductase family protein n=1 Tax=Methanobrevibacter sp. TaxID=66852 RepID=UPI0025EF05B3|nr:nitroreductase family protein [Methanobrevibacter sp.]MBQ2962381.1 nitroreductase family protein [Methanobrevibacter sp.]
MKLNINTETCSGCKLCEMVCIRDNIAIVDKKAVEVDNGDCFDCGHCLAICPTNSISLKVFENQKSRVIDYNPKEIPVSSEDFLDLLKQRRSIRWFKKKKIDDETFDKLFEAAYYSPSAQNAQDVEFVVMDEKLDEFMHLVYDIISVEEEKFFRIKQFGEYLRGEGNYKNHPLLWEGHQMILSFSNSQANALIANARIELLAYTMGLGGFYSLFTLKADELNHDKLMEFFPEIDSNKHMYSAFVIGYPRVKYKRTVPHKKIDVYYK